MTKSSDAGFRLTAKQREANRVLAGEARHILLRGGSRSGKTFLLCRAVALRALRLPSSHAIFRHRFNHLEHSIIGDTFPKMMRLCFPGAAWKYLSSDSSVSFPNGSTILFGGLDDAKRTEKILGQEHSSIYLNECSQISYDARNVALTRLAQKSGLPLRFYYDCNPPSYGHWTYQLFELGVEPRSREKLPDPEHYATMMMNPADNRENLSADYLGVLASLPEAQRLRFLHGQYLKEVDGALWTMALLDQNRVARAQLPDFRRIVVAVDPSGCQGPEDTRSDEIGIVVCGIDLQNRGYVLEDCSGRMSPEQWGARAIRAFDEWGADTIIGETNYGGAMVEFTIRATRSYAPFKMVTASRGKVQRAEPISTLYQKGLVAHLGVLPDLEDQLTNFATSGYQGARSPDRADAAIWGLTELMLDADTFNPAMWEKLAS